MKRTTICAIIIAIVLFTQTHAAATCAWILWTKAIFSFNGKDQGQEMTMAWEPTAFDTHKECEAARRKWLTRTPKLGERITQMSDDSIIIKSREMSIILSTKCLPDTMGPPPG